MALSVVLGSLGFASCPANNLPENEFLDLQPGMGYLTLTVSDGPARAIVPLRPAPDRYVLDFIASPTNGGTSQTIPRPAADVANPIVLAVGEYVLKVDAFINDNLVARGELQDINIAPGAGESRNVTIHAIIDIGTPGSQGTFKWEIDFPAFVTEAKLTIHSGNAPNAPEISYTQLAGPAPNVREGTYLLNVGYYNVEVELTRNDEHKTINHFEIFHIYRNLETVFSINFDDDHFTSTRYSITFYYNDGITGGLEHTVYSNQPHGEKITKPAVDPIRPGYEFSGWFTDVLCSDANEWLFDTHNIIGDLSLYAKWEKLSTGTIGLEVEDFRFTPAFAVSFALTPFVPITPVPNILALSRTGNPSPRVFHFQITSTGHDENSVRWQIGNNPQVSGDTFTLDVSSAQNFTIGGHTLRLSVRRDNVLYAVNIPFTVAAGD